jgi:hypothetical protein
MKTLWAACAMAAVVAVAQPSGARPAFAEQRQGDADTGYLDVTSDPPAKVIVDDVDTGKTTPAQHLPLKVGHHKLTLVTSDGARKRSIGFTVDAGQTTKLSIHLTS